MTKGWPWYLKNFGRDPRCLAGDNEYQGNHIHVDATPSYMLNPKSAKLMKKVLPQALTHKYRFIAVL
eukprot:CAMPEP_0184313962 /NCGR_PEP_ID=MMETSP1049-20130417/69637_1 /TAXON_ID=77928 /ORGANISM="Proteomonas sulcata, Strain CCMP704" /LENGTH=66 /DNA_ID=CAMNT_0026631605 /DNA_START=8 /DNA_END=205 /DNA_ORIENTATION=+